MNTDTYIRRYFDGYKVKEEYFPNNGLKFEKVLSRDKITDNLTDRNIFLIDFTGIYKSYRYDEKLIEEINYVCVEKETEIANYTIHLL